MRVLNDNDELYACPREDNLAPTYIIIKHKRVLTVFDMPDNLSSCNSGNKLKVPAALFNRIFSTDIAKRDVCILYMACDPSIIILLWSNIINPEVIYILYRCNIQYLKDVTVNVGPAYSDLSVLAHSEYVLNKKSYDEFTKLFIDNDKEFPFLRNCALFKNYKDYISSKYKDAVLPLDKVIFLLPSSIYSKANTAIDELVNEFIGEHEKSIPNMYYVLTTPEPTIHCVRYNNTYIPITFTNWNVEFVGSRIAYLQHHAKDLKIKLRMSVHPEPFEVNFKSKLVPIMDIFEYSSNTY